MAYAPSTPLPPVSQQDPAAQTGQAQADPTAPQQLFSDAQLLSKWTVWKKSCTDQRWIYERQWMRNIWYLLNRQWIYFDSKRGQWQDKRLAKWVPRPVTNICKEAVQSVRSMFASINYGTNARPIGESHENIVTASVADDYAPVLHEDHDMDHVMSEFDWWLLSCGNAMLHSYVSYDPSNGIEQNPVEKCGTCGGESTSADIANAQQMCPLCKQAGPFEPVMNPDDTPKTLPVVMPKGVTCAYSPFEYMFPIMYERVDLSPLVVVMRWRDKSYYEQNTDPEIRALARTLSFSTVPQERSMQIFKTLPFQSDLGIAPPYFASGGANVDSEGTVEYDAWIRPCKDFPDGYVVRFAGEQQPVVVHSKQENLPGPLPYKDATGKPIFTFHHARFDTIGGRPFGSSLIDPIIQKQDQINQVDSMMMMIIMRMSNPIWLEPKGAEVEKFTGEPGLVVKWNPLVSGGQAKPERIPGENIPPSLFQFRQLLKQEAEELTGTYDLLKGSKPSGVEAYAAMNLLLERSQARFTTAFKERGSAYKGWFKDALEIERQFGEETRVRAMMKPTKEWAFQTFKKADLSGSVDIIIEDGTLSPKTSLGERASIDHLQQLMLLDPNDTDQKITIFRKFGQESLIPGLDAQVKEAWRLFETFAQWASDPKNTSQAIQQAQGELQKAYAAGQPPPPIQSPLMFKRWYNPAVHKAELTKWCVSDDGRDLLAKNPGAELFINHYLDQIDQAMMAAMGGAPGAPGAPPAPGGAGTAMANSNRNAGGAGPSASGATGTSQNNVEANAQRGMAGQPSPTHG